MAARRDTPVFDNFAAAKDEIMGDVFDVITDVLTEMGLNVESLPPRVKAKLRRELMPMMMPMLPQAYNQAGTQLRQTAETRRDHLEGVGQRIEQRHEDAAADRS